MISWACEKSVCDDKLVCDKLACEKSVCDDKLVNVISWHAKSRYVMTS